MESPNFWGYKALRIEFRVDQAIENKGVILPAHNLCCYARTGRVLSTCTLDRIGRAQFSLNSQ